jgi:hypothetical protein
LAKLRDRARRRNVWFKVLNQNERGFIDLAIKVIVRVRSPILAKSLNSVIAKLTGAMESKVKRLMKTVGCQLAQKLSEIAHRWRNKLASTWASDLGFIQYLAVTQKTKFR